MPSRFGDRLYLLLQKPTKYQQINRLVPPHVSLGNTRDNTYDAFDGDTREINNAESQKKTNKFRVETDSIGDVLVPSRALFGAQTQCSIENFRIGGERMPFALVHALGMVKHANATVNEKMGKLAS